MQMNLNHALFPNDGTLAIVILCLFTIVPAFAGMILALIWEWFFYKEAKK
jgi:hypothetical protein